MHLVAPFLCPSPINTLLLKCFTGSVRNVVVFTGEAALVLGSFLSAFSDLNSLLPSLFSDVWENVFFSFFFFGEVCLFYLVLLMGRLVQMNPPAMGIGGTLLGLPLEAELSRQEAFCLPEAGLRKPLPPGVITSGPPWLPHPPRVCPLSLCCIHTGSQHTADCLFLSFLHPFSPLVILSLLPLCLLGSSLCPVSFGVFWFPLCPHPRLSSEPSEMCVPEKPDLVTAFFYMHSAGLWFSVAPS